MTILVLVRCQDGYILVSDRKATASSGQSEEQSKSVFFPKGLAVAGAGDPGEAIQALFYRLRGIESIINTAEEFVKRALDEFNETGQVQIRCIVLVVRSGLIHAFRVEYSFGVGYSVIEETAPFRCIGEDTPRIIAKHYLRRRNYQNQSCEGALPEVLAIVKQACDEGSFVGSQSDFGFDVIILRSDGYCVIPRITEELAAPLIQFTQIDGVSQPVIFQSYDVGGNVA